MTSWWVYRFEQVPPSPPSILPTHALNNPKLQHLPALELHNSEVAFGGLTRPTSKIQHGRLGFDCFSLACAVTRLILSFITSLVESLTRMFTKASVLVISFVFPKVLPLSHNPAEPAERPERV